MSDVAEDWRVDPVLRNACKPVVDIACRDANNGDARVMSCLMEKIGTEFMTTDCEIALMQIQYFVARDFKLDPQLYRSDTVIKHIVEHFLIYFLPAEVASRMPYNFAMLNLHGMMQIMLQWIQIGDH